MTELLLASKDNLRHKEEEDTPSSSQHGALHHLL